MDRREFAAEFAGILRLQRDHEYLAYAPSGRREYEQKLRSCSELFAYLVYRKTGIPVRVLPGIVPIGEVRDPTFSAGKALAARVAKRARASAAKAEGPERERLEECALLWERAAAKLAEPEQG